MDTSKCSIGISIKQVVFELNDQQFSNVINETLDTLRIKLKEARTTYGQSKAAIIAGARTLEEKGIGLEISCKF